MISKTHPSLPCLHAFWHAIPTFSYIFNVFYFRVVDIVLHEVYEHVSKVVHFSWNANSHAVVQWVSVVNNDASSQ